MVRLLLYLVHFIELKAQDHTIVMSHIRTNENGNGDYNWVKPYILAISIHLRSSPHLTRGFQKLKIVAAE